MPRAEEQSRPATKATTCTVLGRRRLLGGTSSDNPDKENDGSPGDRPTAVGPRKKGSDALVHHGRHFGRTVQLFSNFNNLLREGILQEERMQAHDLDIDELQDHASGAAPQRERKDHEVFIKLIRISPFLIDRLFSPDRTNEDILYSADAKAGVIIPPLLRNVKTGRGFYHESTGAYLCPTDFDWSDPTVKAGLRSGQLVMTGLHWSKFLYKGLQVNPANAWDGLFRSKIMVLAYKHVFISPSAASGESRATRAGNAQIHGMGSVTPASLAYVATLLRFSLSHWNIFNRNDKQADSERFYGSILEFLEDPQEDTEVADLLRWWNGVIFPAQYECGELSLPKTSALAKLKEQRRAHAKALRTGNIPNAGRGSD
ncbi:hypothetical protein FA13DRAFT_1719410 [Coprinellus micaceus]|uniref:Uncharacterized protein n=1 Tax=Coprinellus micaceus TaxID=71717 RepID=A0A4Y7SB68_COPMI|nr:hypothetical protein FA13DRAFT_1719410 [Coprinellus micaceus]